MSAILVLKIGGSLVESNAAGPLMRRLAARRLPRLVIVPGGGEFAEAVRAAQRRHAFGDAAAHRMALLAMEMVAAMLADFAPGFVVSHCVDDFAAAWRRGQTPIWAPTRMVLEAPDIPASWEVTSDSLAAWLAAHIGASRLVLVKACAVPAAIARDAPSLAAAGIVDARFPALVDGRAFSWQIASGPDEAIEGVLG